MKTSDFYYDLPEELIAQHPLECRSSSRLLVLDRKSGQFEDKHFVEVISYLNKGDCLVLNDTRVIPARLFGVKKNTGGHIEFVLLKKLHDNVWEVILRPGKMAKIGAEFTFGEKSSNGANHAYLEAKVLDVIEGGKRIVEFSYEGIFEEVLDALGTMPLPPYITEKLEDPERYQTVYAKHNGSAAAPTAGLHFTPQVLADIAEKGVDIAYVTLHVGLGTFRPVKSDAIENHTMHSEWYMISSEAADKINACKRNGGKIISAGTTSTRVLESAADENGYVQECNGDTSIFIYPGYNFKCVDKLITNFHLPESTLIMLVSALAGKEGVLHAYQHAVEERYRFFSFGDAMLIK